jgi:hypothetical protein
MTSSMASETKVGWPLVCSTTLLARPVRTRQSASSRSVISSNPAQGSGGVRQAVGSAASPMACSFSVYSRQEPNGFVIQHIPSRVDGTHLRCRR